MFPGSTPAEENLKKTSKKSARRINTDLDYKGAASVVNEILGQRDREAAAERRLQALIEETGKFDQNADS